MDRLIKFCKNYKEDVGQSDDKCFLSASNELYLNSTSVSRMKGTNNRNNKYIFSHVVDED